MTIKEIETRSGMTRANIRFYEAEGLLSPERCENGYRDYSEEDLKVLKRIRLLRILHVSLEDIKTLTNDEADLSHILIRHIGKLDMYREDINRAQRVCREICRDGADYKTLDAQRYLDSLSRRISDGVPKQQTSKPDTASAFIENRSNGMTGKKEDDGMAEKFRRNICAYCGQKITDGEKTCPNCGRTRRSYSYLKNLACTAAAVIVIVGVVFAGVGIKDASDKRAAEEAAALAAAELQQAEEEAAALAAAESQRAEEEAAALEAAALLRAKEEAAAEAYATASQWTEYDLVVERAEFFSANSFCSKQKLYHEICSSGLSYDTVKISPDTVQLVVDGLDIDWKENALSLAESNNSIFNMSKQENYEYLIRDGYGEFTEEEAQYAVDNLEADWNENALERAIECATTWYNSERMTYDLLIYYKFTEAQAQYAMARLDVDWNEVALARAKELLDGHLSQFALYDRLTSDMEKFTEEQALYALDCLGISAE